MSELFSPDFLIKLREVLKTINDDNLKQMQKPVMLHLYLILKGFENHPESMICNALDCLNVILRRIEISTWKQFMELFVQLCSVLNPPPCDPSKGNCETKRSEELKLSVVICLKSLMLHSSESMLIEVYKPQFLPPLGHAIWALLQTIELEKLQKLQNEALDCLLLLTQVDQGRSEYFMLIVGNIFASFLPGISSSLSRLLLTKQLPPNKVAAAAIINWAKIVSVVLSDKQIEAIKKQTDQAMTADCIDGRIRQIQVKRDSVWLESTTLNLVSHVNGIVKLVGSQSVKVRMALLEWADILLQHCFKLLEGIVADIVNMLITLVTDEFQEISSRSQQILQLYCERLENNSLILEDILFQNLISIIRNFHKDVLSKDDAEKLILVRRLKGYLKILGHRVESFLNTGDNLQLICDSLFHLLEMNSSNVTIIQDKQIINSTTVLLEMPTPFIPTWPTKTFKHFVDNRILQEVYQLCHLLGIYGNMELLVDYLIPIVTQENRQIIIIINEIIEGGKQLPDQSSEMNTDYLLSAITLALSQYLKPSQWKTIVSQTLSECESKSINFQIVNVSSSIESQQSQNHVLFRCMVLESIGKFAKILGKAFEELLFQVLYPVMESLASEDFDVSYTAYQCMLAICTACENRSLQELVLHNADYLIHGISLRLRHFPLNPRAPLLLKVMLEHCTAQVLPLIENTVYELLDVLDNHYHENSLIFMQVLQSLVTSIHRWFPPKMKLVSGYEKKPKEYDETSKYSKKNTSAEEVKDYFLEYHRLKQIADGKVQVSETDEAEEEEECDTDQQIDNKKESPFHVKAVVQVLERCMHLLSFRDVRLRFVVLNTIQEAALALDDWQDDLLPMVHKIWSPFVQRFRNEEHLITLKAFETLCTLGHICGNFIYKRTIKDVWPHIITYLEKMSSISCKANERFKHNPQFRLLHGLLGGLGTLCIKLDVSEIELDNIASACLPYLSSCQPLLLQEAAIITFKNLIKFDPDAIWLKLKDIYCEKAELQPPNSCFFSVKFAGIVDSEFTHNGEKLLRLIES